MWLDEDPKAAYERLFGESVKAYNEKQTRPDRQITDYYKQICEDSKKKPVYELIIGIYGKKADGTPMDFREPKPIGRDLDKDFDGYRHQGGYDHNFEVFTDPCAILRDPESGRTMAVSTDRPGVQFYCGNFLKGEIGKDGVSYCYRGGICLETQFYPDSINHPEWPQPFVKANTPYHSETVYRFS